MPYLKIHTNSRPEAQQSAALLKRASELVAEQLGKPERYVMVDLQVNPDMLFAGSGEPLAYLELKSIGLPENRTAAFSKALCGLMQQQIGVPKERVYIEFSNASGTMWGWNGATF